MQNGYIQRFNRSFRHEVLDANLFGSLTEVRDAVHQWMTDYNGKRLHDLRSGMRDPQCWKNSIYGCAPGSDG
jgi:putative transposase